MNYPAWQIKTADPAAEQALAGAGCGALLRRVLAARGCTDPAEVQALLGAGAELSDPFLLRDMDKAVARIEQAVENEETIVIYGDYDVDGISATAILYECLSSMGAHVRCKLPTRGTGYGLTRPALESLAEKGFKLVVTVDNGISAIEEAACAKELGLDLIVTDHHLPGETLPDAVAVVDPKRADDESPFKDLCGAGVAFKLCAALEGCEPADLLEMYGELVALGTVADVMPLVGENRTLVREGLALLQDTMRPGLQALMENAGVAGKSVTADTVSYSLAPRLNAAGPGRRHCRPPGGDQHRAPADGTGSVRCRPKDAGSRPCPPAGPRTGGLRRGLAPRRYRHCGRAADGKVQPPRHRHLAAKWRGTRQRPCARPVRPARCAGWLRPIPDPLWRACSGRRCGN